MSDSIKKALIGAVVGALCVLLYVYFIHDPGSSRAPDTGSAVPGAASGGPAPGAATGGGFSQMPVTVVAAPVERRSIAFEIEALGTARANESVDVTAKVVNQVTSVRFAEGQQVKRGDVLVELDSEQVRADLAAAEAALAESRSQYKRSRELYSTQVLSDAQLEQIEAAYKADEARVAAARSRVSDTVIRAPFAGRVGLRRVSVGSLISPGTVITTLDDTSTIKLDFTIPETFLAAVTPGLDISARSVAYPERPFGGKVSSVDSRVDPATRSVTVRAVLPNPEGLLKPGMFLTVRLARESVDALLVPEQALVPEQGDVYVFVVRDGSAEKRKIRIGQRRVGEVQVVDGLQEGELVVTEGTQKLRNGSVVALQSAPSGPAVAQGAGTR